MSDSQSDNPYSAPSFDDPEHENKAFQKTSSVMPGKAVAVFGFMTLLIPAVIFEETEELAMNAIMYGIPSGIAALIFGLKNISRDSANVWDYTGLVFTVLSYASGILYLAMG